MLLYKKLLPAGCLWLTPVILATQKTEIRRTEVWSQAPANSSQDPISNIPMHTKKGLVEWFKWWSTCLTTTKSLHSNPILPKKHPKKLPNLGAYSNVLFIYLFIYLFCSTVAWTQDLHLKPLHQPCFCEGFIEIGSRRTICPGWLQTSIVLITDSWVARIPGVSHQHPACF
jgi:hypothetical protein